MFIHKTCLTIGLILLAFNTVLCQAQSKKNPTTQKELKQAQKESQQQLDKLTPEQRKMMEDMGIPTSGFNPVPVKTTDQQITSVTGNIPVKDDAKIAIAKSYTVSNANLTSYLQKISTEVLKRFSPTEIAQGEEAFQLISKKVPGNSSALENAAIMLWTMGKYKSAIYVLSKLVLQQTQDDNLLNNYASFLTMAGGEQWALPLLIYLDKKYPQNSSILNNLGQAWFGLGDLINAEKYLKDAIRLYPMHPRANFTQSFIEEKKGNIDKAIECVKKSIQNNSYSIEKVNQLRKLKYKLTPADLGFHKKFKPDSDPLGLHNFKSPAIPTTYEEMLATEGEWKSFKEAVFEKAEQLETQRQQVANPKIEKFNRDVKNYMANAKMDVSDEVRPLFYAQAKIMMDAMKKDGGSVFRYNASLKAYKDYTGKEIKQLMTSYNAELAALNKKSENYSGNREGGDKKETFCSERIALLSKYLNLVGPKLRDLNTNLVQQTKLMINEEVSWRQYAQFPNEFEKIKLDYQLKYLATLVPYIPSEFTAISFCANDAEPVYGKTALANFNDLHCENKAKIDLLWISASVNCYQVNVTIDADIKFLKIFADMKLDDENNRDVNGFIDYFGQSFVSSTLIAGPTIGVELGRGPFKLEAEAGVYGMLEVGKKGITDYGIIGEAGIKATAGPVDATLIGVTSKITVNSGASLEGKGILNSINK